MTFFRPNLLLIEAWWWLRGQILFKGTCCETLRTTALDYLLAQKKLVCFVQNKLTPFYSTRYFLSPNQLCILL